MSFRAMAWHRKRAKELSRMQEIVSQFLLSGGGNSSSVPSKPVPSSSNAALMKFRKIQRRQWPDSSTAARLNRHFTDPVQTVHQVLCRRVNPSLTLTRKTTFCGEVYRAELYIPVLGTLRGVGVSSCKSRAEHYAYLDVCGTLKCLRLVDSKGNGINIREKLNSIHQGDLPTCYNKKKGRVRWTNIEYKTSQQIMDGRVVWSCQLRLFWPMFFTVTAEGTSKRQAEFHASLQAYVKIALNNLTDNLGNICTPKYVKLPYHKCRQRDLPDYQVFVDASPKGFGALLFTNADENVKWLHGEIPPHDVTGKDAEIWSQTFFVELYGAVSAVFTWKKKFAGKVVLLWSDNLSVVDCINYNGIKIKRSPQKARLLKVLADVCNIEEITLHAAHNPREYNEAADCLASHDLEGFKSLVPNNSAVPKKIKKIVFL